MTYSKTVVFVEAPLFSRMVYDYLSEDDYAALQWALILRPDTGEAIPGSGGLCKMRWNGNGRGKRGGCRIIYYRQTVKGEIWMLTIYAKNEAENIPAQILRKIKEAMEP